MRTPTEQQIVNARPVELDAELEVADLFQFQREGRRFGRWGGHVHARYDRRPIAQLTNDLATAATDFSPSTEPFSG